jgi:type I restriction-modification system DNA methylase subunit
MNKKGLSEHDICTKFITPADKQSGWNEVSQFREEDYFTKGRIIVRSKLGDISIYGQEANYAWVQHFIHHLAPHGMAGFVLPVIASLDHNFWISGL